MQNHPLEGTDGEYDAQEQGEQHKVDKQREADILH